MVSKFYQRNIAEGKGFLIFAIVFTFIVRLLYFIFASDQVPAEVSDSYFWNLLSPKFSNKLYSILGSTLCLAILALLSAHINSKHLYIRTRTLLPAGIPVLLFSCHPAFLLMNRFYIVAILFLVATTFLFAAYQNPFPQKAAANVSMMVAIASLFSPNALIYIPVLWIGLGMMWCFNFKSFLASLVGLGVVFFPAFSFFFFTDNKSLSLPLQSFGINALSQIPVLEFGIVNFLILVFSLILIGIILVDYYFKSYKDKIRIRAYIRFTALIVVFSLLAYLFLNVGNDLYLYIILSMGSLLLSHYFALAETKGTVILFYVGMLVFCGVFFYFFFV